MNKKLNWKKIIKEIEESSKDTWNSNKNAISNTKHKKTRQKPLPYPSTHIKQKK